MNDTPDNNLTRTPGSDQVDPDELMTEVGSLPFLRTFLISVVIHVVLIGAMSRHLPFAEKLFCEAISSSVQEKFVDINIKAFYGGRNDAAAS